MKTELKPLYYLLKSFLLFLLIKYSISCECGLENIETRIINGQEVRRNRYPWYVKVGDCGGGLVSDRHVITSAHCLVPLELKKKKMRIVIGVHSMEDYKTLPSLEAEEYIIHQDYVMFDQKYYNDIAIIKLKERIQFTDGINPICLPNFNGTDNLFSYGLGHQLVDGKIVLAKVMHEVELDRISNLFCNRVLKLIGNVFWFNKELSFCSLNHRRNNAICLGDSGNPVSTRKDGRIYLVGLPSLCDHDCGKYKIYPNLFENIFSHLKWIRKHTLDGEFCYGEHNAFNPYSVVDVNQETQENAVDIYHQKEDDDNYNPHVLIDIPDEEDE